MNLKIAVVLLFAFIATSQAGYAILSSYSDSLCSSANFIGQFYTNDPAGCGLDKKRSIEQTLYCDNTTLAGVSLTYDFSFCGNDTIPSVPSTWQVLQLSTESTCNATSSPSYTSFLAAPKDFSNTVIAFASSQTGLVAANSSLECNTSGNLTASTCLTIKGLGYTCIQFNLENNVCTLDNTINAYFGLQTTCTAAPVSAPVAAPVSSPVATPVKTPAKASSASLVYSSLALLSVVALL